MNEKINEKKIDEIKSNAVWNFNNGLNCCESVFEAFLQEGILPKENVPYTACALCAGFGGGVGMTGSSCGALSGAIMAVGAQHGRKYPKEEKPDGLYDVEYRRYNNMVSEFRERMGSTLCAEISKENLDDWGGPARKAHCDDCIRSGVEIAAKYLGMSTEDIAKIQWKDNVAGLK